MKIEFSESVRRKLKEKHEVDAKEVCECFLNRDGKDLFDTRENHRTDPPTRWFLAYTNHGRRLKVIYVLDGGAIRIKSAYQPNSMEIEIYNKHGR